MRRVVAFAVLALALGACGKNQQELRDFAKDVGLSTDGSREEGEVLIVKLTDKCEGRIFFGAPGGNPFAEAYYLSVGKKDDKLSGPIAVLVGEEIAPFVKTFSAKVANPQQVLADTEVEKVCFN